MKLFARKNKGHKLVDDDDMEEAEQDFDKIEKGKSVKSAVLVAKDENALIYTSNRADGRAVPKRAQTQQYLQERVGAPAMYSRTTSKQLFSNEKLLPVTRPLPPAAAEKKATGEQRGTQELFSMHKLHQQQQMKINGDNSSSSCYSDASSMSIGANNENKSPLLFDVSPSNKTKIVSPQPASVLTNTSPMIQKKSQQHLISPASGKKWTPLSHHSGQERQHFITRALRRPFGRENIPPSVIVGLTCSYEICKLNIFHSNFFA
jgi:hypothetical protein